MPPTQNLPTRNNNPGDLRDPSTGSFRQFGDPKEGYAALLNDLHSKQTGTTTTGLGPASTLADFAKVYAPPGDNNNSAKYAADLANQIGVAPDSKLSELDLGKWADAVSSNEGYSGNKHTQSNNVSPAQSQPPVTPLKIPQGISTDSSDNSGSKPGFLQGLSEDITGTNPEDIGTQMANTVKGVGNFLFPIVGDVGDDISGTSKKNALQQAGDLGLSVLPFIPGLGEAGEAARGAEVAGQAAKSTGLLGKLTGSTVAKGAASGYGAGALSNLSNGQSVVQAITPNSTNVEGALTGGIAGAVLPKVSGLVGKEAGKPNVDQAIQDAMPLENKATRVDAMRNSMPGSTEGGVVRKGILGKSTIVPDQGDIERGTTAAPYIGTTKDPVAQVQNLNKGIQDVSGQTDSFLDTNATPSNFADMRNYMETNRPNSTLMKDPIAAENYNRATQDALDTLYATMKKSASETGDFGANTSGADIRKARMAIDQQISRELGENTWGTPQYRGIKAAEIDTRNLLNRMSEDMLRYPGQLENLNKMNEFVAASKARGIEVNMDDPAMRSNLEGAFGLKVNPESESKAQQLSDAHKKMSHLYESRDNIIDKYQRKIGKNKVQEAVDSNPIIRTAAGIASKTVPFGLADHFVK